MISILKPCIRLGVTVLICFAQVACTAADGNSYEPDWQSLDQRQTPQWWKDAKFGIFIHWGVYAVPSFSPVGTYAEWYGERMHAGDKEMDGEPGFDIPDSDQLRAFHEKNYGADYPYQRFAPDFRAELFDPEQWAEVFRNSGAQYVVLTSKHHDGFALWPSAEANKSWGRDWNAARIGPRRDLAGELTRAVRGKGLKMGFYYSLYEWYNPLYRKNFKAYVDEHMHPQFKDLVTRYQPSVIFADGEWGHPSDDWKVKELLAWLFNQDGSEEVVINDRWGKETRHRHGGYYTTEYGAGLPDAAHPWEESRGMGTSYGYNRNEQLADYGTSRRLILTLIDTVSRGGNFLLNIGPTADGRIPVIMQDRLAAMGKWLRVNGEAIYGTQTWTNPVQWGEGVPPAFEVEAHGFVAYDIIRQTMNPPEGQAAKELFFTRKSDTLYAIAPTFPKERLVVKGVSAKTGSVINLLGYDEPLQWIQDGEDLVITAPHIAPGELGFDEAYVFRVETSVSDSFEADVAYLDRHVETIVLADGDMRVAVVPAWQGRVMTSTAGGNQGASYGWINKPLIAKGIAPRHQRAGLEKHIHVFGGEDRFWIGPEGGQYAWYFAPGQDFTFANWVVPAFIDTEPWPVMARSSRQVTFRKQARLDNWSGQTFDLSVDRSIRLLTVEEIAACLGAEPPGELAVVGYESHNVLVNSGTEPWTDASGMPSIWILGMFNHGAQTRVVIPYREDAAGPIVKDDYFGKVPEERLEIDAEHQALYFSADGRYRSKIGISPARSLGVAGSWDPIRELLTIVQYNRPEARTQDETRYVNSSWALQDEPFAGDAINSYNDGPVNGGQLGPFYELETSSPALALAPGESYTHIHKTLHLQGSRGALDAISRQVFGVDLDSIETE